MNVPRDVTSDQLAALHAEAKASLHRVEIIKTNCGHCKHFEIGTCALHGDVPVSFQKSVDECDDWRYDGVPF